MIGQNSLASALRMLFCVIKISKIDSLATLIRLVNLRHHTMVEAEFRLLLMRNELTKEGEDVRRFYPLRLQYDRVINFAAALTLRHVIDETSPLFGLTPQELKLADSRMHASIVCVDPVLQAPVQSQTEYLHEQTWSHLQRPIPAAGGIIFLTSGD
jgi:inward rectifier potassium channel